MKIRTSMLALVILTSGITAANAQSDDDKNADPIRITGGGSFSKTKISSHLEKLGLGQVTIIYKLTSTERTMGKERSTGKMAAAKLTAYLETSDGELTNDDFQEVTDNFYHYFQRKLKENDIDTVAWDKIANTDFYKDASDRTATNEQEKGDGQVWVTFNANKGNSLHRGATGFAFGKIKKSARCSDDIDAPVGCFILTVDFADIMVQVKIRTSAPNFPSGYYPYTINTKTSYNAATKPDIKVIPTDDETSLIWDSKPNYENVLLDNELESGIAYQTSVTQDASRIRRSAFAFAKSMDPVVIETTRAKYKEAAEKALERYADAFVAKIKSMRKG